MHALMCSVCGFVSRTLPSASSVSLHILLPLFIEYSPNAVLPFLVIFMQSLLSASRGRCHVRAQLEREISFEFCLSLRCMSWLVWGLKRLNHIIICFPVYMFVQVSRSENSLPGICSVSHHDQGPNSGHQTWLHVSLPTELSSWPDILYKPLHDWLTVNCQVEEKNGVASDFV